MAFSRYQVSNLVMHTKIGECKPNCVNQPYKYFTVNEPPFFSLSVISNIVRMQIFNY